MSEPDDFPQIPTTPEPEAEQIDDMVRQAEAAMREPDSIASKRVLGQVFEKELDELVTPASSAFWSDKRPTRSEDEQKKHEEKLMMAAVAAQAREVLRPHGVRIAKTMLDGETVGGGGYYVMAEDSSGRRFEAAFGLDLAERLVRSGGTTNLVARMGQAVAREILDARNTYLRRAELPHEVS